MERIWANRLHAPGEREAIARVDAVYEAVDALSAEDLNTAPVPRIDLDDRDERLAALETLAEGLGRGDLLDEARDALREAILVRFTAGGAYPYGLRSLGLARTEDMAAIVAALLDLVAVAVVEDRLDAADAEALRRPGRMVLGPSVDPGSDAAPGATGEPPIPGPPADALARAGAPTEADWAEAEHGSTRIDLDR